MTELRIGWKNWVLVCDGAKALFLRNDGDAELVNLVLVHSSAEPASAAHDLGTDRPGRVFFSENTTRSAIETTDLHQKAEEDFLADIAHRLEGLVREKTIEHLVVIAPPKALGFLRSHIAPAVRAVIKAEIPKDLTKLPVYEIETWLRAGPCGSDTKPAI